MSSSLLNHQNNKRKYYLNMSWNKLVFSRQCYYKNCVLEVVFVVFIFVINSWFKLRVKNVVRHCLQWPNTLAVFEVLMFALLWPVLDDRFFYYRPSRFWGPALFCWCYTYVFLSYHAFHYVCLLILALRLTVVTFVYFGLFIFESILCVSVVISMNVYLDCPSFWVQFQK